MVEHTTTPVYQKKLEKLTIRAAELKQMKIGLTGIVSAHAVVRMRKAEGFQTVSYRSKCIAPVGQVQCALYTRRAWRWTRQVECCLLTRSSTIWRKEMVLDVLSSTCAIECAGTENEK